MDDSITRFPKYQRIKKESTGLFLATQKLYPISPMMMEMDRIVVGGSKIVFDI
jgi:hypothetical protein